MNPEPLPLVLLVEDHVDTRLVYAEFLSTSFDVLQAADGEEALELLGERVPALVITDLSLPGMDGFELVRRIRERDSTRQVRVICLSGHVGRAHEARAREVGCDRVLEKPCLPQVLTQAARQLAGASTLS